METSSKNKPTGKTVLLFSGGMDSVMINYLQKPDILLVLPHDQAYERVELKSIIDLVNAGFVSEEKLITKRVFNFKHLERDDLIIPGRNLHFILMAANYGERILLGSVYGDRSNDKTIGFFNKTKDMLDYLYFDQHWCKAREFEVGSPYKHLTKTELVSLYLADCGSPEALKTSYSCYRGEERPCGVCKPCFRKWVALQLNVIDTHGYFEKDPWTADWLPDIIKMINSPAGYRGREDLEIKRALQSVSAWLS